MPEDVKIVSAETIKRCPFSILLPSHWREDGTCRCDCANHRQTMMNDWGYTPREFQRVGIEP